jgi:hypothetical protein
MPTLRQSMAYLMSTSSIADDVAPGAHHLDVLGLDPATRAIYFVETLGRDSDDDVPIVYRMHLAGGHAGHMIPLASWYDEATIAALPHRLGELARSVVPLVATDPEQWILTTRVIQHRSIRISSSALPIRKFALQLTVEANEGERRLLETPVRAVVTAYLRPRATLDQAWSIPGHDLAVVRVTYLGVPSGLGLPKQTALLVQRRVQ